MKRTGRIRLVAALGMGMLATAALACNLAAAQDPTETLAPTEAGAETSEPDSPPAEEASAGDEQPAGDEQSAGQAGVADTIYYGGNIITMEDALPAAQAIAIAGDHILAVGSDQEILALRGESTQAIDLQGNTVMPGFIDTHSHRLSQRSKWGFSTVEQAVEEALSQGWTGVHEQALTEDDLNGLIEADAHGELRLRVNAYLAINAFEGELLPDWFRAYQPGQQISPNLRIAGLKIFIDYDSGRQLLFEQDDLNELMRQLQSEGWTISVKAISIQAHELALNAFEYALNGESNETYRHRIEHSIAATGEQVARMARMGVIACIQPSLPSVIAFEPDTYQMREENGAQNSYRWRDYHDAGVLLIASPLNPFPGVEDHFSATHLSPTGLLYRSVTQVGVDDMPPEAWMLEQTLTVDQMLPMLTTQAAFSTFQDESLGSLLPGKLADLVILSGDPLSVAPEPPIRIPQRWSPAAPAASSVQLCARPGHPGELCP
jgi:predicted amidohydrolase YtcJ